MAKQAETERERRALIICAQEEYQAAQTLVEAGKILADNPPEVSERCKECQKSQYAEEDAGSSGLRA